MGPGNMEEESLVKKRCKWAGTNLLYIEYHDNEWGIPLHDDRKLFELLILEGMQAGLSWITILIVQKKFGSFDAYIWQFVGSKPIRNAWKIQEEIPSKTKASIAMSNDLKTRGFKFAGPTICYAFMQAVGMVNDHTVDCFRYRDL
jgi:DNA-3-methyladenine glycosylase I